MTMTLEGPRSAVTETTPVLRWHAHQAGAWVAYWADQARPALEHEVHAAGSRT